MFGESSFPCPPHKDPALDTLVHGGLGRGSGKGTGHVPTTPRPPERIALFCLLLDSVPLGNPSPSTPQRSPTVSDPVPRTRSLHRPSQVQRPDPGATARRPEPRPVRLATPCPARSGKGALPGQVSGVSAQGQQEPTAAQRPRGPVRPTATPRRGPPARSA